MRETESLFIFYIYHRKNHRKTIWCDSKILSSSFHGSQNTYVFHDSIFCTVFLQTSSTENFAASFGFLFQCSTVLAYSKLFPISLFPISLTSCSRLSPLLFVQSTMATEKRNPFILAKLFTQFSFVIMPTWFYFLLSKTNPHIFYAEHFCQSCLDSFQYFHIFLEMHYSKLNWRAGLFPEEQDYFLCVV